MSVKNILIDVGNSSFCKLAVADGDSILRVSRVAREDLCGAVEACTGPGAQADVICMSSVADHDPVLEDRLSSGCRKFINVSASTHTGITLEYETPATLGADRIAAAAGAAGLFPGEECVIFDFGTALTVDYLDSDGRFKGGNISPGLSMRLSALHHYTGKLPLVSPFFPERKAGRNTVEAISNGVVLGIMFEVEKYIADSPGARVIFTGGDSLFFAKRLKSPIFVVCNLVLEGLFIIARQNNV